MHRVVLLLFVVSCAVAPETEPDPVDWPDAPDPGFETLPGAAWTIASPAGMQQLPEEDVAIAPPLRFGLRGFAQTATASAMDGSAGLSVVPRRGGRAPLNLLAEPTTNRSLVWMLTPIGVYWHNPIVWDSSKTDEGRVLYHVLEGGVLSATWSAPPLGVSFAIEMSAAPVVVDQRVYRLGPLRVRIVEGTAAVIGNALDVVPANGRLQVLVYADPVLDTAMVNAAGALRAPMPGYVAEAPGRVVEKHVHVTSTVLGIDGVLALGQSPSTKQGPVLLLDSGELYVGEPGATTGWRLSSLAVKIIKSGVIGMRRMRYAHAGSGVGGQTFNFYVFSPRGTVTLWPVGRVTAPYRISWFEEPAIVHVDFPSTDNDYSEDLAGGRDVMHTRTTWAWDATTLIEASAMRAAVPLRHTGVEGNSVDGGWRHTLTGPLSTFLVGNAQGFAAKTVPAAGAYRYDPGDSLYATYPTHSVFHHQRAWVGAWADRTARVASLKLASTVYVGAGKDLHNTDVLAAGGVVEVNQVLRVSPETTDPAALRAHYTLDGPLRAGMLDVDRGARPSAGARWDLGVVDSKSTVVFSEAP